MLRLQVLEQEKFGSHCPWTVIAAGAVVVLPAVVLLTVALGLWLWLGGVQLGGLPASTALLLIILTGAAAVLNTGMGLLVGSLDGTGRSIDRAVAILIATSLYALSAEPLIAHFGVLGLPAGMALQSVLTMLMLSARMPLSRERRSSGLAWLVRTSTAYVLQGIWLGATRAGFEPLCKLAIVQAGGYGAVAVFDLANRVSAQIRAMLMSGVQPLGAMSVERTTGFTEDARAHLMRAWNVAFRLAAYLAAGQLCAGPLLSILALHLVEPSFVVYNTIFALAAWVNALGLIGVQAETGSARLAPLLRIHIEMLILNTVTSVGAAIGNLAVLVPLGWGIALAWGGTRVFLRMLARFSVPLREARRITGAGFLEGAGVLLIAALPTMVTTAMLGENVVLIAVVQLATGAVLGVSMLYRCKRLLSHERALQAR